VFNKCFTNEFITRYYPEVFSTEGMVNIKLWGLVYLAAAHSLNYRRTPQPWLFLVLALEKVFYVGTWVWWASGAKPRPPDVPPWETSMAQMWAKDPITALFFAVYGANDLLFAVVFLYAAALGFRAPPPPSKRRTTPTSLETALRGVCYLGAAAHLIALPAVNRGLPFLGRRLLAEYYPALFSDEGVAALMLWGLLYLPAARSLGGPQPQPWLFAALGATNAFLLCTWLFWQWGQPAPPPPWISQPAAAFFFKIWGVWCLCFAWVCLGCSHLCFERERKLDEKRSARLMEQFGDKKDD